MPTSITFPGSPSVDDTYTYGATTYTWSGTKWYVASQEIQYKAPTTSTGTVIELSNTLGTYYNMSSANTATTYTTGSKTLGGFATVRINAASEPTLSGASLITGSAFLVSTDMHMWAQYFGSTVQYFFAEL